MYKYVTLTIAVLMACAPAFAELKVVATLSTFADLVETIGGDHVTVDFIAPPQFNPHFIEPRPSDVLKTRKADVFVHSGLDLESWRDPLLNAAGNARIKPGAHGEISLADGVTLLNVPDAGVTRAAGDIHLYGNPHYWLGPENGLIMARNIATRLSEIDPENAQDYESNFSAFQARLTEAIGEWRSAVAPFAGDRLVAYHDQWPYFAEFAGIRIEEFIEPKPGIPPGPKHLVYLESYIESNGVRGIVHATVFPSKPAQALSKKTGVPVAELAQGVGEVTEAKDYIALIQLNVSRIVELLGG